MIIKTIEWCHQTRWSSRRLAFTCFHPPPRSLGKSTCDDSPHDKSKSGCPKRLGVSRKISSSSAGGRWDQMVLKKKSVTGNPHTCEFVGMWSGWGSTIRTISQININSSPCGQRRRRKALIFEHPPPS